MNAIAPVAAHACAHCNASLLPGQAQFCYTSALPGSDVITAFADTNGDGTRNAGEPGGTAAKTWVLPGSGAGEPRSLG